MVFSYHPRGGSALYKTDSQMEILEEGEVENMTEVTCPKCGSSQVMGRNKGFDLGKAAMGGLALGPVGLLGGLIGSKKVVVACLNCGHRWEPARQEISPQVSAATKESMPAAADPSPTPAGSHSAGRTPTSDDIWISLDGLKAGVWVRGMKGETKQRLLRQLESGDYETKIWIWQDILLYWTGLPVDFSKDNVLLLCKKYPKILDKIIDALSRK